MSEWPHWPDGTLHDPQTGRPLVADTPHSLSDGEGRWPVVDAIPFLRPGRDGRRHRALAALDAGDDSAARAALLPDQDEWSSAPEPALSAVAAAVAAPTLRGAMAALGFGPVGDYFAHRTSDPTYLSALALIAAHRPSPDSAFELGCGIGWLLRALSQHGAAVSGTDVVFAKLWLARRFVVPEARLACVDGVTAVPQIAADLVLCHDAVHYLPDAERAVAALRQIAGPAGTVAIGHAHTPATHLSSGRPRTPAGWGKLLPDPTLYDDAELCAAAVGARSPIPALPAALDGVEAVAMAFGPAVDRSATSHSTLAPAATPLRLNPLIARQADGRYAVDWPSERYRQEYADLSVHLTAPFELSDAQLESARNAGLGNDPAVTALAHRRVLVDLPVDW